MSLSNQSFKHNTVCVSSLNSTPALSFESSFVCSSLAATTEKVVVLGLLVGNKIMKNI